MRAGSHTWVSSFSMSQVPPSSVRPGLTCCMALRSVLLHTQPQTPLLHIKSLPGQVQAPVSSFCISESALRLCRHPSVCSVPPVETGQWELSR